MNNNALFENTSIPKAYFTMALPVVFSMVISLVYNMADTYFVAKTMNTNLVASVSLCAPIFTFMIALGDIFGIGGSSVISRLFGQQMNKEAKNVSGFCFYASILCGIVVTIFMFILKDPMLNFLGVNKETWLYANQYYNIIALGSTFIILSLTPSNLIRTEGLATLSMVGTVLGSILNIILDPIFIFGFHMGAQGAALASVIGYILSDFLLIYFTKTKANRLSVSFKDCHVEKLDNRNQVKIKKISMIFHGFYCTLKIPEEKALFFRVVLVYNLVVIYCTGITHQFCTCYKLFVLIYWHMQSLQLSNTSGLIAAFSLYRNL